MIVTDGSTRYEWTEDWAKTPDTPETRANGRTHGVAVARSGHVYVFHQSKPALLEYDAQGKLVGSYSGDFPRAHGLTLVAEGGGAEYLWLTDEASGLVAKVTLTGRVVQKIERPDLPIYPEKRYSPTWVAVNPENGDVWVADGYGSSYVHRYAKDGRYLASINGEEGAAGGFRCPHAVFVDTRRVEPELYIADRANRRIQVYDMAGVYKRAFGQEYLIHPCAFAAHGEKLYVPELFGRMAVLDGDDRFVGYVGENAAVVDGESRGRVQGWPNVPRTELKAGRFNSPHGIGTGPDGAVYVVEWYHPGGRIVKLTPQSA